MTLHTVESTAETVRSGFLDPTAPPAATVASGDVVSYPNTWTHWGNEAVFGMTFAEREPLRHRYPNGPYSMLGPVVVEDAEPGDVIECRLETLRTRDWGWNSFPLGVGALPSDFAEPYVHYFRFNASLTSTEYVHGISLPLAPFLGVMAVEPSGDDPVSAILSGPYGGNLVLNELTEGASGSATSTPYRATAWSTRRPSRPRPTTSSFATPSTKRYPSRALWPRR